MAKVSNPPATIIVRRAPVDSVILYEIKEDELEILANGDSTNIQFNFAIFLLSIAVTSTVTLLTATFTVNSLIQQGFLFISIIGYILSAFLFLLWHRGRTRITKVIQAIKNRLPAETICSSDDVIDIIPNNNTTGDSIEPVG